MDKGLPDRPGKTPPRLVADLIDYDPRKKAKNGRNLLADPAQWLRRNLRPIRRGELDCKHSLIRKDNQTNAPLSDDVWPDTETKYVVAAYCAHCRYHFEIIADFRTTARSQVICGPGRPNPLHHLLLVESTDAEKHKEKYGEDKYNTLTEAHRWACSAPDCPLEVIIKISPPRLNKALLSLVEDPKKIDSRGRKVIAEEPERYEDWQPRAPAEVMAVLLHYLKDARAKDPNELKKIAIRNKKFKISFSDECESLFKYLDFTIYKETSTLSEEEVDFFWKLPEVTQTNKNFIEDVICELQQRLQDRPAKERSSSLQAFVYAPLYASRDIERSLGYYNYPTRSRVIQLDASEEHPYYAGLGSTENFNDEYLAWAYNQQVRCDPSNKPYYLDCLEDLAKGRESADLGEKFAVAKSLGEIGLKEIDEAYKFFALDPENIEGDDHIIGVYNSRIAAAPRQKDQAKEALLVIGKERNSQKIQQVALDRTMSLEEALEFLGVSADTPSDSIAAIAVVEAGDRTDKSPVVGAMRVIAKHRGGDYALEDAAAEMEGTKAATLGINEAYLRLQILTNPDSLPDENVWEYYLHNSSSSAGLSDTNNGARDALRVIAEHRQSQFLNAKLVNPDAVLELATADEPVGLGNIGNTCYLNSLLQFYYTVKTVRDVVIGFQGHRMALTAEDICKKRVGGRAVVKPEIVKAQKFVDELHDLFENLKTATTTYVNPTTQLAELTLFSSAAEANFRRTSVSSPSGPPNLASINGPVYGPEGPPPLIPSRLSPTPAAPTEDDIEMIESHDDDRNVEHADDSSEATLVDLEKDGRVDKAVNGANDNAAIEETNNTPFHSHPEPKNDLEGDAVMVNGEPLTPPQSVSGSSPPDQPPPVPPRNKAGLSIQTAETKPTEKLLNNDLLNFGAQQDVTEVIGNVLFRLQCAIKPTSIDENGGQRDIIKDTFYGSNAVYSRKSQKLEKKVEEWNSLIVYPPSSGSRDIYDALDVTFDEQPVEIGNVITPQFTSIHKLPPIVQIQINRTDFDQKTQRAWKNTNPVTFPETIYLDRYMDSEEVDSAVMLRRKESWKMKAKLRKLEGRLEVLETTSASLSVPETLAATKDYLSNLQEEEIPDLPIEASVMAALEERRNEISTEISMITSRVSDLKKQLQQQFTDFRTRQYRLHAVFIHRGQASGGHYWIYIYDFERDVWREYNDRYVKTVTDRNLVFEQERFGGGTPYLLSYVRSPDMVDAVHREIPEGTTILPEIDEQMPDLEGVDDENGDAEHIEVAHAERPKPRPLLPKPVADPQWTDSGPNTDPYGKPW